MGGMEGWGVKALQWQQFIKKVECHLPAESVCLSRSWLAWSFAQMSWQYACWEVGNTHSTAQQSGLHVSFTWRRGGRQQQGQWVWLAGKRVRASKSGLNLIL